MGELSKVSFEIFYSVSALRNNSSTVVANAKTSMVCFDYKEKKVESMPVELRNILTC
jgi:acyl-CoA thioesterase FadM